MVRSGTAGPRYRVPTGARRCDRKGSGNPASLCTCFLGGSPRSYPALPVRGLLRLRRRHRRSLRHPSPTACQFALAVASASLAADINFELQHWISVRARVATDRMKDVAERQVEDARLKKI